MNGPSEFYFMRELSQSLPKASFTVEIRVSPSSNRPEDLEVFITADPGTIKALDTVLFNNGTVAIKEENYLRISLK